MSASDVSPFHLRSARFTLLSDTCRRPSWCAEHFFCFLLSGHADLWDTGGPQRGQDRKLKDKTFSLRKKNIPPPPSPPPVVWVMLAVVVVEVVVVVVIW